MPSTVESTQSKNPSQKKPMRAKFWDWDMLRVLETSLIVRIRLGAGDQNRTIIRVVSLSKFSDRFTSFFCSEANDSTLIDFTYTHPATSIQSLLKYSAGFLNNEDRGYSNNLTKIVSKIRLEPEFMSPKPCIVFDCLGAELSPSHLCLLEHYRNFETQLKQAVAKLASVIPPKIDSSSFEGAIAQADRAHKFQNVCRILAAIEETQRKWHGFREQVNNDWLRLTRHIPR